MRKLSKSLAMMGLLSPVGAGALGIGDIALHSALNQQLDAEIPLMASEAEVASDIAVKLAPPEAFARIGIARPHFLSALRFKTVKKPGGEIVVKVTSPQAIREPFLNFLIAVDWPKGHLLREFTVLLDPPASFDEIARFDDSAPSVPARTETLAEPANALGGPSQFEHTEPSLEGGLTVPDPQRAAAPSGWSASWKTSPHRLPPFARIAAYGPVRPNESLWNIAKRVMQAEGATQGASVSHEQMMMALYRNNPDAFVGRDIKALKAGTTLRVPSPEVIQGLSPAAAREAYEKQTGARRGKLTQPREKPQGTPARAVVEDEMRGSAAKLKLLAAPATEAVETAASNGAGIGGKSGGEATATPVESLTRENETLHLRVADLEKKLESVQQLLLVANAQLAAIQAANSDAAAAGKPPSEGAGEPAPLDHSAQQQMPQAADAAQTGPVDHAPGMTVETLQTAAAVAAAGAGQGARSAEHSMTPVRGEGVPQAQRVKSVTEPAKSAPEALAGEHTLKEAAADFVEGIPDFLKFGGAGAALLWVAALGLAISRRRKRQFIEAQSAIADYAGMDHEAQRAAAATSEHPPAEESEELDSLGQKSFINEFLSADLDVLETEGDEIDPITEADLYMAYGRYPQAEELIRQALHFDPKRQDYKLKLFEIYHAKLDKGAFQSLLTETAVERWDPDLREKVAEMGREIGLDNAAFNQRADEPQPLKGSGASDPQSEKGLMNKSGLVPSIHETSEAVFFGGAADDAGDSNSMLELASETIEETSNFPRTFASEAETPFVERDSQPEPELGFEVFENPKIEALSEYSDYEASDPVPPAVRGDEFDFDLEAISAAISRDDPQEESWKEIGAMPGGACPSETVLELLDLDEERKSAAALDARIQTDPDGEDEAAFPRLSDIDEVETKLDLAKAYLDMDDNEAAHEILQEILSSGNEEQRREAQELVDQLV